MPSPKELAAGLKAQEATSPNSKVMFVGQEHGKKTVLPDNVKKMAEKYGAYYEGAGGDKSDAVKYQGSWDDKASKEVKGYPKEFLYTLFTNSNVNNQKKNLTQPDKTIFDSALAAQDKWGYFKDRKFDADTLKQFLSASGMLDKSKQPATESNVKKFIDEGEGLMWPKNWEEYPNPAGKLAQKASEYRTNWLKSQKEGVYFVGSDHMKELNKPKEPAPSQLAKALAYRGEIRNTPQNSFLGGVANFLAPVSEFADQYKISDRIPFLGGMSAADLTGLKGAQSLVNDMSYGKSPISGASLQTTKVDPRVIDLAGVSGAMMPVGKALGKAALREGARQIETGTGIGRAALNPRMSAVPEGASMPQRPKTEFEILHDTAQRNAALPVEQGGLGLPANNTYIDRANAMGKKDVYHGSKQDITGAFKPGYDDNLAFVTESPEFASKWIGKGKLQQRSGGQAEQEVKSAEDVYRGIRTKHLYSDDALQRLEGDDFNKEYDRRNALSRADQLKEFGGAMIPDKMHSTVYPMKVDANKTFNPETDMHVMSEFFEKNNTPPDVQDLYTGGNYMMYETKPVVGYLKSKGYDSMRLRESTGDDYPTIAAFNPSQVRSRFAAFDPMRRHEADILAGVGVGGMLDPQAIAEALRQQDRK